MKQFFFDKKIIISRTIVSGVYIPITVKLWFYSIKTVWFNESANLIIGYIVLFGFIIQFIDALRLTIIIFRKKPALIISDESIYDHQYGIIFYWKDVKACTLWNNMVVLDMNNPTHYIELIKNPVRRIFSKIWYLIFRKKKFRIGLRILDTDSGLIFNQFEKYDLLSQEYTN
jgi:hypothetical protein